jgi:PAS domain S-box-containing protein
MNKELELVTTIPNLIILKLVGKSISKVYGEKSFKKFKGKALKELFRFENYKEIKKVLKNKKSSVVVQWNKKTYEVTTKQDMLYFYDISKYSGVESKLQQSLTDLSSKKEELHAIFDLAANGISLLDRNGYFLYANKFFQDMMEYTMEELYKESCISLSSPEYAKPSQTAVAKAIRYGSIEKFRKVCITKSGKRLNASMSLSYLKSRDEIIMITSDITEDIKYQDKLKKQVEMEVSKRAEQYEIMCHQSRLAAMGEMIDSIAHQWRQPLNSLGIIVQGLGHFSKQKDIDSTMLKEVESEIMEKVNYMSQTIDDFSTFFRTSKQKEHFNISHSIKETIRLIDVQLQANKISIEINIEKGIALNILGYANEFRQVMLNMVHNAMMAIISTKPQNPKIQISIKSNRKNIHVEVLDNGGGIAKDIMPKIFDPYFTTKDSGSGIGLYMSKVIIETHMEGLLAVKNKNDGALFTIMLPQER